ncbi:hypothetical protein VYU27_001899 [Nannochloropsis oceanica]
MRVIPPLPPFLFEHGKETGYRLCAVPLAAATPQATIELARALPGGDLLALVDHAGCLRVLEVRTQTVIAVYQIYRGSFLEEEEGGRGKEEERLGAAKALSTRVRPPGPCSLPWTDLTFVPGREDALFLLLGETHVVMYTTLPPPLDPEDLQGQGPRASASFAYGSPLIVLRPETAAAAAAAATPARIRTVGVDTTGSVLASGDDEGCLCVWTLSKRRHFGLEAPLLSGGDSPTSTGGKRRGIVNVVSAHDGPLLKLAHGEALAREEGHLITGGGDRTVKIWSWRMDEWGALVVRKLHTLLTEACDVRGLAAGGDGGLILGGGGSGTLYCWSSLTAVLEYVAMDSEQPLVAVAAYAEAEEEQEEGEAEGGARGGEASVIATADAGGVVRLYRPVVWEESVGGREGVREGGEVDDEEEEEEEEERNTWHPVAESPLDGPAIGAFFMHPSKRKNEESSQGGGRDRPLLVVVSNTGMVVPWPVATLPRYPGDDNRIAALPRREAAAATATAGKSAAATGGGEGGTAAGEVMAIGSTPRGPKQSSAEGGREQALHPEDDEEESEAIPRQGPLPSPSPLDASTLLAPFTSLRAWERDTHLLSSAQQPCELSTPTLHSTALLRDQLATAYHAEFPSEEIHLETKSVLEDAATAVNVHPLFNVYKDVPPRNTYTLPPPQLISKQIDPRWRAKRERRPTARDFFTPDLEEVVGAGVGRGREEGRRRRRQTLGQEGPVGGVEDELDRERESPYLALYRGAVGE